MAPAPRPPAPDRHLAAAAAPRAPDKRQGRFLQLDRAGSGWPRLTVREGDCRTAPIVDSLVRWDWYEHVRWTTAREDFFAKCALTPATPVYAWKGNQRLGTVGDLLADVIAETGDYG